MLGLVAHLGSKHLEDAECLINMPGVNMCVAAAVAAFTAAATAVAAVVSLLKLQLLRGRGGQSILEVMRIHVL